MHCKRHAYTNANCIDCKVSNMGCTYNGLRHIWVKGQDHCDRIYCGEAKPNSVYATLDVLGWTA